MLMAHDHPRPDPTGWRDLAACRGVDPDVFFPSGFDTQAVDRAKQICRGCDVRADCLDFAMALGTTELQRTHAIYGGETSLDIARAKRRARRRTA